MPAYVVMFGETPVSAAFVAWTAEAQALAARSEHEQRPPEFRWDDYKPGVRRLKARYGDVGRFHWTGFAVHEVPLAEESA